MYPQNAVNHNELISETVSRLSYQANLKTMCHLRWNGEPLPSQQAVLRIVELSREVIFPGFYGSTSVNRNNIVYHIGMACEELYQLLVDQFTAGLCFNEPDCKDIDLRKIKTIAKSKADEFISVLPELRRVLYTDVNAMFLGDPAAVSTDEVIYCYPAIRAISSQRIAHEMVKLGIPIIPRMITEHAHFETGIDIHPDATIGEAFVIDHGTGVVIGATAILGDNVKLYQGVTLGAKSFESDSDGNPIKGIARHPIIGNNVIIYANATILGRVTIGEGAIIGGNVWLTRDVAPGEKVVQSSTSETK
jgi:serine O-acetyltransferase